MQVFLLCFLRFPHMASFKETLIREPKASSSRPVQNSIVDGGETYTRSHQEIGSQMDKDEDDLPDIDQAELSE